MLSFSTNFHFSKKSECSVLKIWVGGLFRSVLDRCANYYRHFYMRAIVTYVIENGQRSKWRGCFIFYQKVQIGVFLSILKSGIEIFFRKCPFPKSTFKRWVIISHSRCPAVVETLSVVRVGVQGASHHILLNILTWQQWKSVQKFKIGNFQKVGYVSNPISSPFNLFYPLITSVPSIINKLFMYESVWYTRHRSFIY